MAHIKTTAIIRTRNGLEIGLLGFVRQSDEGFTFLPMVSGRNPSRKFHLTLEACLPRWIGKSDTWITKEQKGN